MNYWPVIMENIKTGRIGIYTHALPKSARETRCGMTIDIQKPDVQMSVEPEGTEITCLRCVRVLAQAPLA